MIDGFEALENAFVLTADGRPHPVIASSPIGASAVVLESESSANEHLQGWREDLELAGRGTAGLERVGDPWQFMRRAAGEGLGSIVNADTGDLFMFMVRVEEAGSELPTVLTLHDAQHNWGPSLTRSAKQLFKHSELLHWTRYDILDRVSGSFGQLEPFRHWNSGDALFELGTDDVVALILEAPLLGDWNSTDGSYPFFTSHESAQHYLEHHLPYQRHIKIFRAYGSNAATPEVRPVTDISARLAELRELNPLITWCVNPDDHRENQAFGRVRDPWNRYGDDDAFRMSAVSGIWAVREGNRFELQEPMPGWSGRDTISWSGGQSLALSPLDTSFGYEPLVEDARAGGMTDLELEDVVIQVLDGARLDPDWSLQEEGDSVDLDNYVISCWDSVTGFGGTLATSTFMRALSLLAAYEREHDSLHRATGALSCQSVGFEGSKDTASEDERSARFRSGLERLGGRVLAHGYRPSDANDLVALCNGVLRTLHVDYAGYVKDLLWAVNDNELDGLLGDLSLDSGTATQWRDSAVLTFSNRGESLGIERLGETAWSLLSDRARFFVATALHHLEIQGHAPQLDYAPISIEIVKALEVELGELLLAFRSQYQGESEPVETDSWFVQQLAGFIAGGKAPSLGTYGHFLRRPESGDGPLLRGVREYVAGRPNADFLLDKKFRKSGLHKVAENYRNGGAHETPISEQTCRMCVDDVLGSIASPGYLPQLVSWKARRG